MDYRIPYEPFNADEYFKNNRFNFEFDVDDWLRKHPPNISAPPANLVRVGE